MANILNASINSSLGDLDTTLENIKKGNINISTKSVQGIMDFEDVPYYLLEDSIEDTQEGIYPAIKDIVSKSIQHLTDAEKKETAIIVGTSIIDWNSINAIETTVYEYKRKEFYTAKRSIDSYAKDVSKDLGLNGFTMTINTACTSSANALLEASNLVDSGIYKYVVVVGLEIFSFMMSSGFNVMQLLNKSGIKPFDTQREGTVLGEGLGVLLVGSDASQWRVRGGYTNCDGVNITALSPEGDEVVNVMTKALELSNVKPEEITALKAHATGTQANDLSEMNALAKVFDINLVFTALKPYIGHTIGACGVLEMAILMACIDDGFIPKTLHCTDSLNPSYKPLQEHKACQSGLFMLNYFGFGGNNTSLILEKEQL